MKSLKRFILSLTAFAFGFAAADAAEGSFDQTKAPKVAVVNFKTCVEKSKMGKKEQATFDAMKKQMETVLEEKEKALTDVAAKFNDIDYLDSLSPEAEAELKGNFRKLNQEYTQQQNQFYQVLSQTNIQVIQKLNDAVKKAAEDVAKNNQIDIVVNEEGLFYHAANLDISDLVVKILDEKFEKESKDAKPAAAIPAPAEVK